MDKPMDLKEFMEAAFKESPTGSLRMMSKLIELEGIEKYLNVMWGVELDIKVVPAPKKEGRFYGVGVIESLKKGTE